MFTYEITDTGFIVFDKDNSPLIVQSHHPEKHPSVGMEAEEAENMAMEIVFQMNNSEV